MYELIVIFSLMGSIAGLTVILRLFAPRFTKSGMTIVSACPSIDTKTVAATLLETYLNYRQ